MEREKNYEQWENKNELVIAAFREFDLKMNIAKYPDLLSRLVDIGEHFQDAVEMARMIDRVWKKLEVEDVDRDSLLTATLLHDVGKAGPMKVQANSKMRETVGKLFPHGNSFAKNFDQLAEEAGFFNSRTLAEELSTEITPIGQETPVIEFWRYHVDWTYDVLKQSKIDEKITRVAASHHFLEGKNPANLNEEELDRESKVLEVTDKYHAYGHCLLALTDKYQAIMERGAAKSHQEAVNYLRQTVEQSSVSEKTKQEYLEIIERVFVGAEKDFEEAIGK